MFWLCCAFMQLVTTTRRLEVGVIPSLLFLGVVVVVVLLIRCLVGSSLEHKTTLRGESKNTEILGALLRWGC